MEFGAAQDRDRIILIGFHQDAIDRLHLQTENGSLINFPWEVHKRYNLQEVKNLPWPNKSPYQENTPTPMPDGIIAELTIQHWWTENDVTHHPNANMYFQPRAGIVRFRTKEEGDVEKNVINVYIDGDILQPLLMGIMRFIYTPFSLEEYLLQNHWQFNHCLQILFCHKIYH